MNRSVERRQFGAIGTIPGEILVGHHYTHPVRGPVRCPAAPLVTAGLRRAGHRVREVPCLHLAAHGDGDGSLFAASYIDRGGHAVGLVAAVHRADEARLAAAREVIMTWSAVWRTRRVMVADVRNACAASAFAVEIPGPRRRRFASLSPSRDRASGSTMTMPPAVHVPEDPGVAATCAHVARAHAEAQQFADNGDHLVVIGSRDHAEASALLARAPGRGVVVESEEEVAALDLPADRVGYLVQPGARIEAAMAVLASLRRRYPRSRGAHPDHLCYAGSDRLETIRLVIGASDRTILLGDPDATTSCVTNAATVEVVDDPTLLRPAWLAGAECVGVVPAGPPGAALLPRLIGLFSGLGPLVVLHRRVITGIASAETGEVSNSLLR
jgi:4-hydroxy-3-methylbut-2-enyl diphosphate reductase